MIAKLSNNVGFVKKRMRNKRKSWGMIKTMINKTMNVSQLYVLLFGFEIFMTVTLLLLTFIPIAIFLHISLKMRTKFYWHLFSVAPNWQKIHGVIVLCRLCMEHLLLRMGNRLDSLPDRLLCLPSFCVASLNMPMCVGTAGVRTEALLVFSNSSLDKSIQSLLHLVRCLISNFYYDP